MGVAWLGISEAIAALQDLNTRVDAANMTSTVTLGAELERAAKNNFAGSHPKGRPHYNAGSTEFGEKPNVVTGTLRRSIRATPAARIAGGYLTTVGPTVIYGRRVELGFVGADSLGRRYNQPAYPFFGPGVRETRIKAKEISTRNWAAALGG